MADIACTILNEVILLKKKTNNYLFSYAALGSFIGVTPFLFWAIKI